MMMMMMMNGTEVNKTGNGVRTQHLLERRTSSKERSGMARVAKGS